MEVSSIGAVHHCLRDRQAMSHVSRKRQFLHPFNYHRFYAFCLPPFLTFSLVLANYIFYFLVKSQARISAADKAMDQKSTPNGHANPGVSIRNGPVDDMDVNSPQVNGNLNGKRKTRASLTNGKTYKEASSSEDDDKPLVRSCNGFLHLCSLLTSVEQATTDLSTSEEAGSRLGFGT